MATDGDALIFYHTKEKSGHISINTKPTKNTKKIILKIFYVFLYLILKVLNFAEVGERTGDISVIFAYIRKHC